MKRIFILISVVLLFCAVFIVQNKSDGFNSALQDAETAKQMELNSMTVSSMNAAGIIRFIPENVPPEIMGHNNHESINVNYVSKSNFEKQADAALSLKIQQILTGNPQLAGKVAAVKITTVDRSVILQGTVNSENERANIFHQIENMVEVDHVDNQLKVESK